MKIYPLLLAFLFCFTNPLLARTNSAPSEAEARFTAAIEDRTEEILTVLALSDTNQAARVHDIIIGQYRALRAWHDQNDAKVRAFRGQVNAAAQIHATLQALHDRFLSDLGQILSPEQVERVKDKMTYGKVQSIYAGYLAQYPTLSDDNKAEILRLLNEAREEALDGGSLAEKTAVFQRYKEKINHYLSRQGLHPGQKKTRSIIIP